MKSHIYLILILLIVSSSLKSQISHKVSFTEKELTFEKILGENKQEYMKVKYSGLSSQGTEGAPELPMKYIQVRVPAIANNISIIIEKITKQDIPLSTWIYPAQPDIPTSILPQSIRFIDRDPIIYNSNKGFPEKVVAITDEGYLYGNIHIITLAISPMVYYPEEKRMELNSEVSFRINYSTSETGLKKGTQIINRTARDKEIDLRNIVINPDFKEPSIETNSIVSSRSISSNSSISLPVYEYVVITTNNLKPSFNRLVSWKRTKGYNAGIVTIEDILNDSGITGDSISGLNDSAGKIRQYLMYASDITHTPNTKYVFFGGDGTILPLRYGSGYDNRWYYGSDTIAAKIPTDLYFSDLNGNWKVDTDKYLGEPSDALDYYPELFVGRLLCENGEDIDNYTYKLMKYERNPGNGNFNYLQKAFFTQSDQMQFHNEARIIAGRLHQFLPDTVIFEEEGGFCTNSLPSFPTGNDVIAEMNNEYGFVSWFGHGSPCTITASSKGLNVTYNLILSTNNTTWPTTENTFVNLTNYFKPSIAYTTSCTTMPYDKITIPNVSYDLNMGQAFTTAGKFGGPIYLGNTRYGWTSDTVSFASEGPSKHLFDKFVDRLVSGDYNIGICEAMSKPIQTSYKKHWLALAHNLIGCPELELWTGIPKIMSNITIPANLTIEVPDSIYQPRVCVNGLFGGASYHSSVNSNQASFSLPSNCKNYTVAVTKHNYIPYIAPLYLQNESVSGTHYVHTSDVQIGSNVTSEKQSGNFVITSSADVRIEPIGEVTLDAGFRVDLGGELEIKANQ